MSFDETTDEHFGRENSSASTPDTHPTTPNERLAAVKKHVADMLEMIQKTQDGEDGDDSLDSDGPVRRLDKMNAKLQEQLDEMTRKVHDLTTENATMSTKLTSLESLQKQQQGRTYRRVKDIATLTATVSLRG